MMYVQYSSLVAQVTSSRILRWFPFGCLRSAENSVRFNGSVYVPENNEKSFRPTKTITVGELLSTMCPMHARYTTIMWHNFKPRSKLPKNRIDLYELNYTLLLSDRIKAGLIFFFTLTEKKFISFLMTFNIQYLHSTVHRYYKKEDTAKNNN